MSEGRRRELQLERDAQVLAGALIKEFTRAERQRMEEQAARERWLALSPEERNKYEQLAAEARHQQMQRLAAEKEHARQSYGGSLDSMQVSLTEMAYKSLLYGALLLAFFSYCDLYRSIHRDQGDFPSLCRWVGPFVCLWVGSRIERQLERMYQVFDRGFSTGKFLMIFLFSAPATALSGLLIFGWLIDRL